MAVRLDPETGELIRTAGSQTTPDNQIEFLTDAQLSLVLLLPDKELSALVMRSLAVYGAIAILTEEETAQAMLDVLAEIALRPVVPTANIKADIQSRLAAIDKWLDRTRGKPAQSILQANMDVKTVIEIVNYSQKTIEGDYEKS